METVRIRTPQSLLRLLPRLIGPTEAPSLIALPFERGRSGMPMVLDLPHDRSIAAIARAIRAGSRGADAVVLVACLEAPIGAAPLPLRSELDRLVDRLASVRLRCLEVLALAPDAWGDYASPEGARGPLAELDLLDDPAPGVPALPAIPGVPVFSDVPAARAVERWLDSIDPVHLEAAVDAPIPALERAVELASRLDDGPGPLGIDPAREAALAIALVAHPMLRDLAIELAIDGVDTAAATLAAIDEHGSLAGDTAAERFLGCGPEPDPERLHDRLRRWTAIAEVAPLEARGPLLVIVGFLHFFVGRGRTAGRCAELAMAVDPDLTMAPLLRDIVDAKGAPDWVLHVRPDSRLRPGDRE
ncbi:DUF4192 family protein [Agrococcus citreus]